MAFRALLFLSVFLLVLGGACTYMARRSMALWEPLGRHPRWVWGFIGLFVALTFLVPLVNRLSGHRMDGLYWLSYGLFSLVSTYVLYLAAADLLQFLARRLFQAPASIGAWALAAAVSATILSAAIGLVQALGAPRERTVDVPIPDLPPAFEGYRIVQISDLHLGPLVSQRRVDRLVAQANVLSPDLIAITGDLVDGEADGVRAKALSMAALRARDGVCFVTGNHEYYSGVGPWLQIVRQIGWRLLMNEHVLIQRPGATLAVAGIPDPTSRSFRGGPAGPPPDLAKALTGIPGGAPTILLYHPPTGYASAERSGVSLQLSGHTHNGQYFPWTLVVPHFYRHPKGLARHGRLWIYTSPGTGFWGPPNRFLEPPELTSLVLRAE